MGEFDKAFSIYGELLKADPSMLQAKEGGALTLIAKGDYNTPIDLLEQVLQTDPHRPQALNAMGVLFTTRNMHTEAQRYFAEALKLMPDNPVIMGNIGLSQALAGRYREAGVSLSKASSAAVAGSYERKRADMNTALVHAAAGRAEDALTIASAYYGGLEYSKAFGLYTALAADKKMAANYLHQALAGGRTYYEKGWDNIQAATR
jgi:Flp pilus assembly protein TadD